MRGCGRCVAAISWGDLSNLAKSAQLQVVCIGSANWDIVGLSEHSFVHGSDRPGRIVRRAGGVALNVAAELAQQAVSVALLTAVGNDAAGIDLLAAAQSMGINVDYVSKYHDMATDSYMAIEGADGVVAAVADARCLEAAGATILQPLINEDLAGAKQPWRQIMLVDGNLEPDLLADIAANDLFAEADLRIVSASNGKVERLACFLGCEHVSLYLNRTEANILLESDNLSATKAASRLTKSGLRASLVSDGANALAHSCAEGLYTQLPPRVSERLCTGAGDVLVAAHIAAQLRGFGIQQELQYAANAAARHVAGTNA